MSSNQLVSFSAEAVARAVDLLREGEVIGFPTETVYGLAADGLNPQALARIFLVKRRPLYDPLILHTHDIEAAWALATDIPAAARKLAEAFWPGPLTLVLRKNPAVPDLVTSGLPAVALRVPAHPVAQAVLRAFDGPLAAPSANRFGRISPTTAQAVQAELGSEVSLILDGGPCAIGLESTVLDFSQPERGILLLRAGGIPLEEIEARVGPVTRSRVLDAPGPEGFTGPGQLRHHYAPRKPLYLVATLEEIPAQAESGWLAFGPVATPFPGILEQLSPQADLTEAATRFFHALRALDDHPQVQAIYALPLPGHGLGLAMNERLERARK